MNPALRIGVALFALLFGAMTLKEGGSVLFIDGAARAAAGNYVPFVLWFNFLAGFTYIAAAAAVFLRKPWAPKLAGAIALATLLCFVVFGLYTLFGGAYEHRTVVAMSLRTGIWGLITWLLRRSPAAPVPHNN